jgi:hypothetical protein
MISAEARSIAAGSMSDNARRVPPQFLIALGILGLLITLDVVPGVFTPDDNNYLINVLMLRQGRVTVANTEGLKPSRELLFFHPGPWSSAVEKTPVASTAPPLYAPIALPFSLGRWRGLVALNTLSFLVATLLVFVHAQRYATAQPTAWLAAGAFALGGFVIEYAEGLWPHVLSIAICTGGIFAAARFIDCNRLKLAAGAGFLLALGSGIRYQNAVFLPAVALGISLLGLRWRRGLVVFALAAAVPLAASSAFNRARLDSWNPISKGKGYMRVPFVQDTGSRLTDPLIMFWAQVVDYSARPLLLGPYTEWDRFEPSTGAHLMMGFSVKKALVQSAPWAVLGLLVMAIAWLPSPLMSGVRQRQLRFLSLPIGAVLATFSFAGVNRHDGLSFNQRYFLELLPLIAVAFAWAVDGMHLSRRLLIAGTIGGAFVVVLILTATPLHGGPEILLWRTRHLALMKVPLAVAAVLLLSWTAFHLRLHMIWGHVLGLALGMSLGWGTALHLLDDLQASHALRHFKLGRTRELARVLPDHSAFVAYFADRDPAVPLLFDRDIVILDAIGDDGEDAPVLIKTLLQRGRRVFLLRDGFSEYLLAHVTGGLEVSPVHGTRLELVELH